MHLIDSKGVVFKIVPFNFPLWLGLKFAIPSIALGNSVLIRPPESCPQVGELLSKQIKERNILGLDVVFSDIKSTQNIIQNRYIKGISFTGSDRAGSEIASLSQKYLKPCELELGGNDSNVFFEDINIIESVKTLVNTKLGNNGQVCVSPKRIFIHASIFNKFKKELLNEIKRISHSLKFKKGIVYGSDGIEKTLQNQLEKWKEFESYDANILRGNWKNGITQDISVIEVHGNYIFII